MAAIRRSTSARREELLRLVRSGVTRVEDLADRLVVSVSTVRRDLGVLEDSGKLARTYGGATSLPPFKERDLVERMATNTSAKAEIGRLAASLIPEGATIFVDAGSTAAHLVDRIHGATGLTVVTRGLETALALAEEPGIEVLLVGGRLWPRSHGTAGALAAEAIARFSFDVAFLGADAIDPADGIGEPTVEEAYIKELVAARSARVVVLADSSKLEAARVPAWARLPHGWMLISDSRRPQALAEFRAVGIMVLTPESPAAG
ncbi:DeoR/GlpR family DNA-binding transcription regulator [Brevibacterium daeguense]|uniref:Lactose phosphotransferase system repressor n=1 Tax=Brevibacterium daeguense TaxID=909936 RepID=A0ABP8EIX5_9MICO|nr:DeoR/GlpR family DNA-binding transcription regulator [Brevibacterium daeguense]